MSTKRVLTIVLVANAILLAVGIGPRFTGTARALPPAQAGMTIPYSGRLTDEAGRPVADGAYGFTFALYVAASGGEPLWTEMQEGVAVQSGGFTARLGSVVPLPKAALDGGARWLEVSVRGPREAEFTLLSPRQELSVAAPVAPASLSAGPACAHDHLYENWIGSNAGYTFRVENTSTGDGIRGVSYATTADYAGVVGAAYASGGSGVYGLSTTSGRGVYGVSATGDGVVGEASVAIKSGVYGNNTGAGYGVFGRSATGYGGGFTSADDNYDLFLGGAVGRINANEQANSQLYLSSNGDVIVKLDNDSGGNNVFHVWSSGGADLCTISEVGGLVCSSKSAVVKTADYGWRRLYTVESPEVWFEDLGTASLVDGKATVALEPIFAETVNLEED